MNDPIEALRAALELNPDNVALRLVLARSLRAAKRWPEAEVELKHVLRLEPESIEIKIELAQVFSGADKISEAMVLLEDLASKDRLDGQGHLLLSTLLLKRGQIDQALWQYRHALECDPEIHSPELDALLGRSLQTQSLDGIEQHDMVGGPGQADEEEELESPKIRFADVGGMEALKEELRMKIILPLTHPELFEAYGKSGRWGHPHVRSSGLWQDLLGPGNGGRSQSRFPLGRYTRCHEHVCRGE